MNDCNSSSQKIRHTSSITEYGVRVTHARALVVKQNGKRSGQNPSRLHTASQLTHTTTTRHQTEKKRLAGKSYPHPPLPLVAHISCSRQTTRTRKLHSTPFLVLSMVCVDWQNGHLDWAPFLATSTLPTLGQFLPSLPAVPVFWAPWLLPSFFAVKTAGSFLLVIEGVPFSFVRCWLFPLLTYGPLSVNCIAPGTAIDRNSACLFGFIVHNRPSPHSSTSLPLSRSTDAHALPPSLAPLALGVCPPCFPCFGRPALLRCPIRPPTQTTLCRASADTKRPAHHRSRRVAACRSPGSPGPDNHKVQPAEPTNKGRQKRRKRGSIIAPIARLHPASASTPNRDKHIITHCRLRQSTGYGVVCPFVSASRRSLDHDM